MKNFIGFTLIEVLVAMVIVAIVFVSLINTSTMQTSSLISLKNKTIASWVASNRLAQLRMRQKMPHINNKKTNVHMAGQDWVVKDVITQTAVAQTLGKNQFIGVRAEIYSKDDDKRIIYQLQTYYSPSQ
ncbi:MAG: type II secretion system protein GspI [Gammaproteobacteria bacterium]|nr:MAG: type II secretion system protein GspI [Gammaproteobacteria bacterium]